MVWLLRLLPRGGEIFGDFHDLPVPAHAGDAGNAFGEQHHFAVFA